MKHTFLNLKEINMFGWHENSGIAVVLRIGIITVQPNTNLLFRNSENGCCYAIPREMK
jgi:hypothetical protein